MPGVQLHRRGAGGTRRGTAQPGGLYGFIGFLTVTPHTQTDPTGRSRVTQPSRIISQPYLGSPSLAHDLQARHHVRSTAIVCARRPCGVASTSHTRTAGPAVGVAGSWAEATGEPRVSRGCRA